MPYSSSQKRRDKRRNDRVIAKRIVMFDALASLIKWSSDGEYSHASDVLPGLGHNEVTSRLSDLMKMGYVESTTFKDCCHRDRWWRVTDAGRDAYDQYVTEHHANELQVFIEELKRELLGGGIAVRTPAVGDPDRRGSMAVRETLEMEAA
jgi:hypothetical protein